MINQDYLQNYLFSNVIQMSCLTLEVCSKKKVRTKGRLRSLSFQLIGHCTKRKKLMMMITSVDMVMIISFYYIFYLTYIYEPKRIDSIMLKAFFFYTSATKLSWFLFGFAIFKHWTVINVSTSFLPMTHSIPCKMDTEFVHTLNKSI